MNFLKQTGVMIFIMAFATLLRAQELPWGDTFEDGDMAGWTIVDDEPYSSGPSQWAVIAGELYQTSNIFTTENEYSVFKGTHVVAGNKDWTDYYFAARMTSNDDDGIGLLFRYQDPDNYYRFITVADPGNRGPFKRLEKQINGSFTTLAESRTDVKIPGNFVGKVRVAGDSIYVFEDNKLLFAVRDNSFGRGKIGLMCYANSGAIFDDIYVGEQDSIYQEKQEPPDPEILVADRKLQVKALTLNIWVGGKICTPAQVADLIKSLDLDFAGLQECNFRFGNEVAALTGMYMTAGFDCFLYSRTPFTKVKTLPVQGINAWTNIDSQTVSVYNFHIGWDEAGDRAARTMVDELFSQDPVPLQVAFGDFNDEHYSTQITILEEHMRYCLADLGWAPSQRVTWPAFGFYGGEGAQTIDLVFCNKQSKGRAVAGEIMNTAPVLSDHKPVWALIEFPADKASIAPALAAVKPFLGAEQIELWFDCDLDRQSAANPFNYQISPLDGGSAVSILQALPLKDPRRVLLVTSPHQYDKKYHITAAGLSDEFGSISAPGEPLSYTVHRNLLENEGAEAGLKGWEIEGGFTAVSERENQTPFNGSYFFTGENLQDYSAGIQRVDLSPWAREIDAKTMAAVWNCYFATGYEVLGEIRASRCEPYDEGEMLIEFLDGDGRLLLQTSSKRWDTLYWHPYGETTMIPAGTRTALVHLVSYRKTANGLSNDAAFDNAFFALSALEQPHHLGRNLLANASAESGDLRDWNVSGPLRARAHEDNKARPLSGYYLFSSAAAASGEAYQSLDMTGYAGQINAGGLAVQWGGYMRDYRGDSGGEILIEFYDNNKNRIGRATTGVQRVAEWWYYNTETPVPPGTESIKFVLRWNAVDEEGVYFDLLHLLPVENVHSAVARSGGISGFFLAQNYPNPFNAGTRIDYSIEAAGPVTLRVFNMIGQEIDVLVDKHQQPGAYNITWNGTDRDGKTVPSGLYLYELTTVGSKRIKKMMLLK